MHSEGQRQYILGFQRLDRPRSLIRCDMQMICSMFPKDMWVGGAGCMQFKKLFLWFLYEDSVRVLLLYYSFYIGLRSGSVFVTF